MSDNLSDNLSYDKIRSNVAPYNSPGHLITPSQTILNNSPKILITLAPFPHLDTSCCTVQYISDRETSVNTKTLYRKGNPRLQLAWSMCSAYCRVL